MAEAAALGGVSTCSGCIAHVLYWGAVEHQNLVKDSDALPVIFFCDRQLRSGVRDGSRHGISPAVPGDDRV